MQHDCVNIGGSGTAVRARASPTIFHASLFRFRAPRVGCPAGYRARGCHGAAVRFRTVAHPVAGGGGARTRGNAEPRAAGRRGLAPRAGGARDAGFHRRGAARDARRARAAHGVRSRAGRGRRAGGRFPCGAGRVLHARLRQQPDQHPLQRHQDRPAEHDLARHGYGEPRAHRVPQGARLADVGRGRGRRRGELRHARPAPRPGRDRGDRRGRILRRAALVRRHRRHHGLEGFGFPRRRERFGQ